MSLVVGWSTASPKTKHINCFCCFLFRDRSSKKEAGYEAFVVKGWSAWNRKSGLKDHIGDVGSVHNQALKNCDALLRRDEHIDVAIQVQSEAAKVAYFM